MPNFLDDSGLKFPIKNSKRFGTIGETGKYDMPTRKVRQGERGASPPPVTTRNATGPGYHSTVTLNSNRTNIHGRIDWSAK